jgi:hypothetical protein
VNELHDHRSLANGRCASLGQAGWSGADDEQIDVLLRRKLTPDPNRQ